MKLKTELNFQNSEGKFFALIENIIFSSQKIFVFNFQISESEWSTLFFKEFRKVKYFMLQINAIQTSLLLTIKRLIFRNTSFLGLPSNTFEVPMMRYDQLNHIA
jgi:hypothetical protein